MTWFINFVDEDSLSETETRKRRHPSADSQSQDPVDLLVKKTKQGCKTT